jgi:hypothetical protein
MLLLINICFLESCYWNVLVHFSRIILLSFDIHDGMYLVLLMLMSNCTRSVFNSHIMLDLQVTIYIGLVLNDVTINKHLFSYLLSLWAIMKFNLPDNNLIKMKVLVMFQKNEI